MKQAQLPDGTILEFPPETQDDVIDRVARQHLGLPEPVDKGDVRSAQMQDLVVQAVNVLTEKLDTLGNGIAVLTEYASRPAPEFPEFPPIPEPPVPVDVTPVIEALRTAVIESNAKVIDAVTAPREVVTPDGRRFTSTVRVLKQKQANAKGQRNALTGDT